MVTTRTPDADPAPVERTEHPHVVKSENVLGGNARIGGTRISVFLIWTMHQTGTMIAEILDTYSWLMPVQVYDAISYPHLGCHKTPRPTHGSRSHQSLTSDSGRGPFSFVVPQ